MLGCPYNSTDPTTDLPNSSRNERTIRTRPFQLPASESNTRHHICEYCKEPKIMP